MPRSHFLLLVMIWNSRDAMCLVLGIVKKMEQTHHRVFWKWKSENNCIEHGYGFQVPQLVIMRGSLILWSPKHFRNKVQYEFCLKNEKLRNTMNKSHHTNVLNFFLTPIYALFITENPWKVLEEILEKMARSAEILSFDGWNCSKWSKLWYQRPSRVVTGRSYILKHSQKNFLVSDIKF